MRRGREEERRRNRGEGEEEVDGGGGRGVLVEDIKGVTRARRGRWVPTRGSNGSVCVCLCLTKPGSPADCAPEHVSPALTSQHV